MSGCFVRKCSMCSLAMQGGLTCRASLISAPWFTPEGCARPLTKLSGAYLQSLNEFGSQVIHGLHLCCLQGQLALQASSGAVSL